MDFLDGENTVEKMLIKHGVKDKRPVSGTLELTPLCNMNCDMCYVHLSNEEMNKQGKILDIDEWFDLANQLEKAGVLFIMLTGGEPLLFPGFKELYLKLKRMGMVITVNTNGTLIDEKWAAFLVKINHGVLILLYMVMMKKLIVICVIIQVVLKRQFEQSNY
ncbi:radical SAM protein [Coprobacillaceae bacterium CR2/5/TPMF4]|nr:radical SAM protein [Coprobacillaceae bacterium CR2/5/TPMF4]